MSQLFLTDDIQPTATLNEPPPLFVKRRLRTPVRDQMLMRPASLDQELPPDHPVRLVWTLVEQIDVSQWLKLFKAVADRPGRDGHDLRLLLAIWVWATVEGEVRPDVSRRSAVTMSPTGGSAGAWFEEVAERVAAACNHHDLLHDERLRIAATAASG